MTEPPDRFSRTFSGPTEGSCQGQASAYARELVGSGYRPVGQDWARASVDHALTVTYQRGAGSGGSPTAPHRRSWAGGVTALVIVGLIGLGIATVLAMAPRSPHSTSATDSPSPSPPPSRVTLVFEASGVADYSGRLMAPPHSELRYRYACGARNGAFVLTLRSSDGETVASVAADSSREGSGSRPLGETGSLTAAVVASACPWWFGIGPAPAS